MDATARREINNARQMDAAGWQGFACPRCGGHDTCFVRNDAGGLTVCLRGCMDATCTILACGYVGPLAAFFACAALEASHD